MGVILVVEDESEIANVVVSALEDEGYSVVKACNGYEGLEMLRRVTPLIIVTDFMMPNINGLEFASIVRETHSIDKLPIILMSGAQAYIGVQRADLFNAVLQKPFSINVMIAEIRKILSAY